MVLLLANQRLTILRRLLTFGGFVGNRFLGEPSRRLLGILLSRSVGLCDLKNHQGISFFAGGTVDGSVEAILLLGFRALWLEFRSETGFLSTFTAQSVRIFIAHQMNSVFLWSICLFTQCIRNQHFRIFYFK